MKHYPTVPDRPVGYQMADQVGHDKVWNEKNKYLIINAL